MFRDFDEIDHSLYIFVITNNRISSYGFFTVECSKDRTVLLFFCFIQILWSIQNSPVQFSSVLSPCEQYTFSTCSELTSQVLNVVVSLLWLLQKPHPALPSDSPKGLVAVGGEPSRTFLVSEPEKSDPYRKSFWTYQHWGQSHQPRTTGTFAFLSISLDKEKGHMQAPQRSTCYTGKQVLSSPNLWWCSRSDTVMLGYRSRVGDNVNGERNEKAT